MDDTNFSSGENIPSNIADNGHRLATISKDTAGLVPIAREATPSQKGTLVPFPQASSEIFQPTTPSEFLPSIGWWVNACGMLMVASFVAAIGLSTILKYKVTILAPASIRPVGELRLVQSTIEGSVLSISVQENQTVRKGDPIATVKDLRLESKLQTKRSQLTGDIQQAQSQIKAIDAQIAAFDRLEAAEKERNVRTIAGIRAEFSRAERDYRDKQITTQAEVAEAEANLRTARRELQAAEIELKVADAHLKSIQAGYQSVATRLQRYQSAAAAGAISTNQLEESKLAAEQQLQSIAAQSATISKQEQIVARVAETVTANVARVHRTKAALHPSPHESTTIIQKIATESATGRAAIARMQQDRQKLVQQRVEIVNQVSSSQREIAQITTELQPISILAPISGKIQELNLRNNLQVVRPGDRIAQIVPLVTTLNIKAAVAISDIDNVKVGQIAKMRVSACPYSDYGVVSGKVSEISADIKQTEKNLVANLQQSPAANNSYDVTIKPDTLTLVDGANKCQIRSGMDGRVDIISREETVLQFILRKARIW